MNKKELEVFAKQAAKGIKILYLYAKGMTTREIVDTFKEMYDADISPTLISRVTNAVIEQVIEWQARPLDSLSHCLP